MSTFESSYKSMLQGVSQQIPKERLPGQVTAQLNMLSDPVTNLRRRPGAQIIRADNGISLGTVDPTRIKTWFTDVSGERCHVVLNTLTGRLALYDTNWNHLYTSPALTYLQGTNEHIHAAAVGNEFFLCNTQVTPTVAGSVGSKDPATLGFFYIVAGSFSRAYVVTVQTDYGTYTASYTTPSGTGAGDAALATPEYIAEQLRAELAAVAGTLHYGIERVSSYVYIQGAGYGTTSMTVNSSTGGSYVMVSKDSYVTQSGNLPAQLPISANGYICRVGAIELPQYYMYDSTKTAWLESGAYGSPTSITHMPISVHWNGSVWTINATAFEGRTSGDQKSNPNPAFIENGISGIGTYQGRLVLLAGPEVCLSASSQPRRFYRTTVTSIVESDTIGVGAAMNNSASYRYCLPYQKDLLLFSDSYQALIPSGNQAISPRTATVLPTSGHEVDTTSPPLVLGRTIMYPSPRSADFFGIMELAPSSYTDSQYVSQDATPHLPKYMSGRCRFSVSSSIAGTALFAPSGDTHSLLVYEYLWSGDEKVIQSWHMWTFPYHVASAHFAFDKVILTFAANGYVVFASIDPKAGALTFDLNRKPFMDFWVQGTVVGRMVDIPAWMVAFDPDIASKLRLTVLTGDLAGERVGAELYDANTLQTTKSFPSGAVAIGLPYTSLFSPTPPMVRDSNDVVISTNKATVLRFLLGTKNSQQYEVVVGDLNTEVDETESVGTLTWSSQELELGRSLFSNDSVSIIPARTNAASTELQVSTDRFGELNITSLEYVTRYNQKISRR